MGGRAGGGASGGMGSRSRGSVTKDATMQGYSNSLARAVKNAEDSIKDKDIEHMYVFDDNGNIVAQAVGTKNKVGVHHTLQADRVTTHNHPGGGSLSEQDVVRVPLNNPKEIRVVDGTYGYRYTLKRPSKGWADEKTAKRVYKRVEKKIKEADTHYEYGIPHSNNVSAWRRIARTQQHRIVKEFAKQMGYTYTKAKIK